MADQKLSALTDIGTVGGIQSTDIVYIVRPGTGGFYQGTIAEMTTAVQYQAVTNFAALPSAAANSGVTYLVLNAEGVIWINRKPAGLWNSDGVSWNYLADQTDAYLAGLTPTSGQIPVGNGTNFVTKSVSGDATLSSLGALTLATVNTNVGSFGSATQAVAVTVNAKGLITAISVVTITPAVDSLTGLGTGVLTALKINVGTAGAFVVLNGAGGTPSAIVLTNGTGLPIAGITGLGTGVGTALAIAVGSAGAFVVFNGAGGTPTSLTLTNASGLPIAGITGLGSGVATALAAAINAAGGFVTTDGTATLTLKTLTDAVNNVVTPVTTSVGYLGIPQNSKSANYTTVLADAGKHLYHPGADTTARTWTIDSNANVAYPIGTAITFINDTSGGTITIAITSDTLVLAGAGTTGNRTLAANGIATAVKMTSTRWMISGTGLT